MGLPVRRAWRRGRGTSVQRAGRDAECTAALTAHTPPMAHRATHLATVAAVAMGCCLVVAPTAAQSPSPYLAPPPSAAPITSSAAGSQVASDPLVDGLLQATDLPGGMVAASDVVEGSDYDIDDAAFVANQGTRIVSRTWGMDDPAGTSIVFDFRMQFPTPEAASAYLAAALPTLSEATSTGLQPLPQPGPPPMGEEVHLFGLDTQGDNGPVSIRTYIFRVGPVVAKVLAGGANISAAQAEIIAREAATRMQAAGAPAPGSPRPAPTPTPAPSGSPLPLPSGDLVSLLLAHIPADIATTCSPDSQRLWEGEVVTLVCAPADADVEVTYSGFDTADHMGAAYQSSLDTIDLSQMADSCDAGTFSGSYQLDNAPVGQLTCWQEGAGQAIMWSDDRLSILSVAVSPSLDAAGLYLWWEGAGPAP